MIRTLELLKGLEAIWPTGDYSHQIELNDDALHVIVYVDDDYFDMVLDEVDLTETPIDDLIESIKAHVVAMRRGEVPS